MIFYVVPKCFIYLGSLEPNLRTEVTQGPSANAAKIFEVVNCRKYKMKMLKAGFTLLRGLLFMNILQMTMFNYPKELINY